MKIEQGYYWYKGPFFGLMGGGEDWEVLRIYKEGYFERMGLEITGDDKDLEKMQKHGRLIKIEPPFNEN